MKYITFLLIAFMVTITANGSHSLFSGALETGNAYVILKVDEGLPGHQLLLDADAGTYATVGVGTEVFILSYRPFEYKIPANADRNPATINKVTNGSQGIAIPAGTYDYFITRPSAANKRIECDYGTRTEARGDHFVFEAGKVYRFNIFASPTSTGDTERIADYEIRPAGVPADPSAFTVTSNSSGASKCTLNWKNPDKTAEGGSLPAAATIIILRDGLAMTAIPNATPGANATWTDNNPLQDEHTYTIYASNSVGKGFPVSKKITLNTIVAPPVAAKDVAIVAISQPVGGSNLSNAETVTVTIKNKGNQSVSGGIPLNFYVDGVLAGSGNYSGTISAGAEVSYSFTEKANLSAAQTTYILTASTALSGDENPGNDAFSITVDNWGDCRAATPYFCGFEEDTDFKCWKMYNSSATATWERINRRAGSPIRSGRYGMVRLWNATVQGQSWLVSPRISIPATGVTQLSFWSQFYRGTGWGTSSVRITESADPNPQTANYTEIWSPVFESVATDIWFKTEVDLSQYKGKEIYIAFYYEAPNGQAGHRWALDDMNVVQLAEKDAGVTAIHTPKNGVRLSNAETITATVRNFGTQTLDIPVYYKINDGTAISETVTALGSQKEILYTFNTKADFSAAAEYKIEVATGLTGDEYPENNSQTIRVTSYGRATVSDFPYRYGFENPDSLRGYTALYPGPLNIPGIEDKDVNAPHSGNHFWRFVSFYGNGSGSKYYDQYLITPELTTGQAKTIEFYYRPSDLWAYENFKVGYSTTDTQPESFTWVSEIETTQKAWAKYSNIVPGDVKYIAVFYCSGKSLFLYVDDIMIDLLPESKDVAVTQILSPVRGQAEPAQVKVTLKNLGGLPVTSMNVAYQFMNQAPVVQPISEPIAPATSVEFTFDTPVDISQYRDDYSLKVYTSLEGDLDRSNDTLAIHFLYRPDVKLYGYRVYDNLLINSGIYTAPVSFHSGNPSQVTQIGEYWAHNELLISAEYVNDTIYGFFSPINSTGILTFVQISSDWTTEIFRTDVSLAHLDMAFDYTTNTMYAVNGTTLRKVNRQTGAATAVAATREFIALACSLEGQLYGVDLNGWFCRIDKKTGAATPIKMMNPKPTRTHQSMAFDHNSGRLFWAFSGEGLREDGRPMDLGRLYEINPETGDAVNLGSINGAGEAEIIGLYTPYNHGGLGFFYPKSNLDISVYPNPSEGEIRISSVPQNAVIHILDLSGRTIETHTGSGNVDLNLNLPKGVYFIQIEAMNEKVIRKLIIR